MGKKNASKFIKRVQDNYAKSFTGRAPTRPPDKDLIVQVAGWAAFKHRYGHKDNKLWIPVKVVHVAALGTPKRRGARRTFWLYWGFDERRFRRSNDCRLFQDTAPPEVYEGIVAACTSRFTVERLVVVAGEEVVAQERAKLTVSTAKRIERTAAKLEAAHSAALEENELWERLYR